MEREVEYSIFDFFYKAGKIDRDKFTWVQRRNFIYAYELLDANVNKDLNKDAVEIALLFICLGRAMKQRLS